MYTLLISIFTTMTTSNVRIGYEGIYLALENIINQLDFNVIN